MIVVSATHIPHPHIASRSVCLSARALRNNMATLTSLYIAYMSWVQLETTQHIVLRTHSFLHISERSLVISMHNSRWLYKYINLQ